MTRRIEDLQCGNLKILQDDNGYCFSSDSVLLANFFKAKKGDRVVELCSGSGVISILGTAKTSAEHFDCFEIQSELAQMCKESVKINNLTNITVHNTDLKNAPEILKGQRVDVVVVNPPYYTNLSKSVSEQIDIATHERTTSLSQIASTSGKLLKHGGKLYMVHIAERFAEICYELIKNNLQPKQVVLVRPTPNKNYSVVLIEATKGAKVGLKFDELLLANEHGNPTEQINQMYNNKK